MKKITKDELEFVEALANTNMAAHPYIRKGQAFFNALHNTYPWVADEIRATKYDPFHIDSKLELCKQYICGEGDIEESEKTE